MPAIATITINDGATTPVAHNFTPVNASGGIGLFKERVGATPDAYPVLSVSVREPSKTQSVYQVEEKIRIPVTAVVDGVTKVVRYNEAIVTYKLHRQSAEQERKDIRVLVANLTAHNATVQAVEKLEPQF